MVKGQLLCYILEVAALPGLDETTAVNASLAAILALLEAGPYPLLLVWLCSREREAKHFVAAIEKSFSTF